MDLTGINYIFRKRIPMDEVIVLMYHGVVKDSWSLAEDNWLQVKESEFRRQMQHLKKHFDVVDLGTAIRETPHQQNTSQKPKVAITFDDGYMNNYTVAYPILKELQLPATIFVVTNMIDNNNLFWYDRIRTAMKNSLTTEQITNTIESFKDNHPHTIDAIVDQFIINQEAKGKIKFVDPKEVSQTYGTLSLEAIHDMGQTGLIKFDSHTSAHEIVIHMKFEEVKESITNSVEKLKKLIPTDALASVFCFPNGWFNNTHMRLVQDLGFNGAVSTEPRRWSKVDNLYSIPRIGIGRNMKEEQFKGALSGAWTAFANAIKKVKGVN